jgi:hypothetical protein
MNSDTTPDQRSPRSVNRQRRVGRNESWNQPFSDNPGRPGKDGARLVGSVPLKPMTQVAVDEAGFTGSSEGVRAPSVTRKKEPCDEKR